MSNAKKYLQRRQTLKVIEVTIQQAKSEAKNIVKKNLLQVTILKATL